jgi:hypothetical protein
MEERKESEIQGESLLAITNELLYVRERESGDIIPIPWDALAGGGRAFLGDWQRSGNPVEEVWGRGPDLDQDNTRTLFPVSSFSDASGPGEGMDPGLLAGWINQKVPKRPIFQSED